MDNDSASDWDSMSEAVQPSAGEVLRGKKHDPTHFFLQYWFHMAVETVVYHIVRVCILQGKLKIPPYKSIFRPNISQCSCPAAL